ncbi:MAG TPA: DNA-binding response regulator [Lachnospiraceae bacterium]|jgi:DNA-binding NarL/FixJ family response regulator|nr:response regulator transcription factor [Lachnospiraceae bacterium]HAN51466.1 DNA-binding response regulator [Lachnospiraceae bacterium]HBE08546.1 DNA-binding response regulator [Lachnospiraceae bacterium]
MEKKRIVIIDDDDMITMSLEMIISADPEFEVVAKGHSGRDAIRLYQEYHPDLLLSDIRMEDMNGLDAAEEILAQDHQAVILLLTTFSDDEYIVKALKLGVKGYLLKQDYTSLLVSLRAALNGQSVFGGAVVNKLPEIMQKAGEESMAYTGDVAGSTFDYKAHDITEKEYQVIQLVSEGYSNKEIAERIFLSEGTVRNYLSQILEKLELRDRTQLAIFYLRHTNENISE